MAPAPRSRIAPADDWRRRILPPGRTVPASWQEEAYAQYRARLTQADYPCFFGQAAERAGEMFYAFVGQDETAGLAAALRRFVALLDRPAHARHSLVAFFQPEAAMTRHKAFVAKFWETPRYLHAVDPRPGTDRQPDDPLWEFSFDLCEMFVVAASPTYRRRRSRCLGPGMVLIFQPRILFTEPATGQPIAAETRHALHRRMLAYDGMAVHPDIGFYGDPDNREWKQYALPDDDTPAAGRCPVRFGRP